MTNNHKHICGMRGVSLLEILIAMGILGIIVSVAIPSMSEFGAGQRLVGAAEQIHGHLQQARSESVSRSVPVFVKFSGDGSATWTYGMSLTTGCTLTATDPTAAGSCYITVSDGDSTYDGVDGATDTGDRVLMRFLGSDFDDVEMATTSTEFRFDPIRGTANTASINLESSNGRLLRVSVSVLGRISICSPDGSVDSYEACA